MEMFVTAVKELVELGFSPLNIVLIAMLYFMGAHHGMFPKFWNKDDKESVAPTIKDLHDEMAGLKAHFNDETTDRLDTIIEGQQEIKEGVQTVNRKHEEYDKFGIKVRDIKTWNTEINKRIGGGLTELPDDPRDFNFGALYTLPEIDELPEAYSVGEPLEIKDQKATDYCTAYALTAVSEDQEGIPLLPEFQFMLTKEISGDFASWGANLRDACKSSKYGSLPKEHNDAGFDVDSPREEIVDPDMWSPELREIAQKHRKESYLKVDGPYDLFDNLRATLWKNREEKRSVVTGALWRDAWTRAENGMITSADYPAAFGHAFKVYGWLEWQGEPMLMAQLSNGTDIGDEGTFYFSRDVVNKEFRFGAYTFKDITPDSARYHQDNRLKVDVRRNWFVELLLIIKRIFV